MPPFPSLRARYMPARTHCLWHPRSCPAVAEKLPTSISRTIPLIGSSQLSLSDTTRTPSRSGVRLVEHAVDEDGGRAAEGRTATASQGDGTTHCPI